MSDRRPVLRRPGEGESVWSLGGRFTVKLDDVSYQTMNWSLGGLLIEGYEGERAAGETVQIAIKAKDNTAEFRMKIAVKVIRVVQGESIALQFEAMSPEIYEFFERCFADRFKRR